MASMPQSVGDVPQARLVGDSSRCNQSSNCRSRTPGDAVLDVVWRGAGAGQLSVGQDGQLCSAELVPATGPLCLAARRLGPSAGALHDSAPQRLLVFPRQRAPDRIDNLVARDRFGIAAPDSMYCNEIHPLG